ncbi:MAG: hypothetical protein R3C20_21055 [Planctomycetaceae bacterium]
MNKPSGSPDENNLPDQTTSETVKHDHPHGQKKSDSIDPETTFIASDTLAATPQKGHDTHQDLTAGMGGHNPPHTVSAAGGEGEEDTLTPRLAAQVQETMIGMPPAGTNAGSAPAGSNNPATRTSAFHQTAVSPAESTGTADTLIAPSSAPDAGFSLSPSAIAPATPKNPTPNTEGNAPRPRDRGDRPWN